MLTTDDLKQIKHVLQPEFDSIRSDMKSMELRLTKNMKDYVQDAGSIVLNGVEEMFKEHLEHHHSSPGGFTAN